MIKIESNIAQAAVALSVDSNSNALPSLRLPTDFGLMFGGQGYAYLPELRSAYKSPHELTKQFIASALHGLATEENREECSSALVGVHKKYPFVSNWPIDETVPQPAFDHVMSSTCSFPLIFITQIANYLETLAAYGVSHEIFASNASIASGHSQGVVAAYVLSISKSTEDLLNIAVTFTKCMFWFGVRSRKQDIFIKVDETDDKLVVSSPLLHISGLDVPDLQKAVAKTIKELNTLHVATLNSGPKEAAKSAKEDLQETIDSLHVSLINGNKSCVVSGKPKALLALKDGLLKISAKPNTQNRIPFSKRMPVIGCTFLAVSCPFHSPLIDDARLSAIESDWTRCVANAGLDINEVGFDSCRFPIVNTHTGLICDPLNGTETLRRLIHMQGKETLHFPPVARAVSETAKLIFEFGPGSGASKILVKEREGSGVLVVTCRSTDPFVPATSPTLTHQVEVVMFPLIAFSQYAKRVLAGIAVQGPNWAVEFAPTLVEIAQSDGASPKKIVVTRFTQCVKRPPVMMAGMTPTTSLRGLGLVSACTTAGYHGELAGGGLPLPDHFTSKIKELTELNPPGAGINVNMLYLNAHLFGFQFPMFLELARAGFPMESVTVAAGVPTPEKAEELLAQLAAVGNKYLALKPGTAQAILDCLKIASFAKQVNMSIIVQWTGGRGGGHHSFEDFHEPLLETYAAIRRESNVILIVGSGFGDAQGSYEYITGTWSLQFHRPGMPCDGILMGSRCMVAKEAATAERVKDMLVETKGVDLEREWEISYEGIAGGVITVTSELGEPIHKIHNRGMDCWREFDKKYFSLERGPKRLQAILKGKRHIVGRLNNDFQKVYFPTSLVDCCDLEDMTYLAVLKRMVALMYVVNGSSPNFDSNRWIDYTYQTRTFCFLVRTERRFLRQPSSAFAVDVDMLAETTPMQVIDAFAQRYPESASTLLADDDVSFFVDLCRDSKYGKPVNFVPRIDGDLDFWFKKDSLWYSEDLDAVPNRDPERVCVLQGPLAVRLSAIANEPIADILGSVHDGWVQMLLADGVLPVGGGVLSSMAALDHVQLEECLRTFPFLKSHKNSWHALVLSPFSKITKNKRLHDNVLCTLFQAAVKEKLKIQLEDDSIITAGGEIALSMDSDTSRLNLRVKYRDAFVDILYQYNPSTPLAPLIEIESDTKSFYEHVWLESKDRGKMISAIHDVHESTFKLAEHNVLDLNRAILRIDPVTDAPSSVPSLDAAIVCGWQPLIKTLFSQEIQGDLLRLVHLSHGYRLLSKTDRSVHVNETITSRVRVVGIEILKGSGKKITCRGILYRANQKPWVEISSSFLIRGEYNDYDRCFTRPLAHEDETFVVPIHDDAMCAVLTDKPWIFCLRDLQVHERLVFHIDDLFERRASEFTLAECVVLGTITSNNPPTGASSLVGRIDYSFTAKTQPEVTLKENPVVSFLRRQREATEPFKMLENGGVTLLKEPMVFKVPRDWRSFSYGKASHDLNPIHSSTFLAALAGLPDSKPIVHGMWSCALARQVIEKAGADSNPDQIARFDVDFVGMLPFGEDELVCQATFIGVVGGRKIVRVEIKSALGKHTVLKGRAEIDPPKASYLFTGQGSASVGMGMDRYQDIQAVRLVWDRADVHLQEKYGFSVIDIVRNNPMELKIQFGGPKGRVLRENYRSIRVSSPQNPSETMQLLSEIQHDTKSFTFKSGGEGLLFATQFAQPALVILQKSNFQELIDNGLVSPKDANATFAGHSLGEYAGLAAFAEVLSIEDLVETVFLRGMVMQNAVKRDARGRSSFGMVAVNPSRVKMADGSKFTPERLYALVDAVGKETNELLQVVNYNIRNTQYVAAGHLLALDALEFCLSLGDADAVKRAVDRSREKDRASKQADVAFELQRGAATVPLPGIDVPFHSRQLLSGVPAFRELLEPRLSLDRVSQVVDRLIGKYIPNVTAKPFRLDLEYVELTAKATGSKALTALCTQLAAGKAGPAQVARTLLIELLAHQFAMPVLWIETQDVIFREGTRRVVELGPAPTLATMAQRTFDMGIYGDVKPEILYWGRDLPAIMYSGLEDSGPNLEVYLAEREKRASSEVEIEPAHEHVNPVVAATVTAAPLAVVVATPSLTPPAPVGGSADQPVSALHTLRTILTSKFKVKYSDVKLDSSIKLLSAGKSAVQNEVVGDIANEFGGSADSGLFAEILISELAAKLGPGYKQHGKTAAAIVSRTLAAKLPGNFPASAARAHLASTRGFGANLAESVLLHGCACAAPTARLAGPPEAKKWLDDCCDAFAADTGSALPGGGGGGQAASQAVVALFDFPHTTLVQIVDAPPTAKHALQVLLSSKMRIPLKDIKDESSIKSLSAGKSAVQNEIVGDISQEFSAAGGDGGNITEIPINELSGKVGSGYKQLGKVTLKLVAQTLAAKLPGSFPGSAAREYLGQKGFGPGTTDSVLLHAVTLAPSNRLNSLEEAKAWLDQSTQAYAAHSGRDFSSQSVRLGSGGGGGGGGGAVDSAALKAFEKRLVDLFQTQSSAISSFVAYRGVSSLTPSATTIVDDSLLLLQALRDELGDKFIEGVAPAHNPLKVREYDSYWNWVVQDAIELHCHVLAALRNMKGEIGVPIPNAGNPHFQAMADWIRSVASGQGLNHEPPQAWFRNFLCNRATKELLVAVEFFATKMLATNQPEYAQIISLLAEQVEMWIDRAPVLVARAVHDAPVSTVTPQGKIEYKEVTRNGVEDCVAYVEELSRGALYSKDDVEVMVSFDSTQVQHPSQSVVLENMDAPLTETEEGSPPPYHLSPRNRQTSSNAGFADSSSTPARHARPGGPLLEAIRDTVIRHGTDPSLRLSVVPLVQLKSPSLTDRTIRVYDERKTAAYLSCLHGVATRGVSFADQVALITGGGIGSIAIDVVKMLLEGGATVISAINYAKSDDGVQATLKRYRKIFEEHGSKGSRLITEPCNAGSAQDVQRLVKHVYEELKLDVDFVVPFAALPERGRDISQIDSECELSHRAMLTNVVRLVGAIKEAKASRNISTRPALVLLPCSPNHGVFGNDGLYAESKLGIEALVDKWKSEGWQNYVSIAACVVGWTRSQLMSQNNLVAQGIEELGCRTFSTTEMAVNLVALMHPHMVNLAVDEPLFADLTGGWTNVKDLDRAVTSIRKKLQDRAAVSLALYKEKVVESNIIQRASPTQRKTENAAHTLIKKLNLQDSAVPLTNPNTFLSFPPLPSKEKLQSMGLANAVDLERVVCVVGYGEVGPWGNARTRWEMEAYGQFSLEGCVEVAWLVGLIKHHDGPLPNNPRHRHVGWVDATSREPVLDHEVKRRYEQTILKHSGVRVVEPALFEGYDPNDKKVWTRVGIDRDMPEVEVSSQEHALQVQKATGGPDKCDIVQSENGWRVRLRAGAVIAVPRAFQFNRFVCGQIPTGWSAERLGIPADIVKSVDPVTLYALASTMDAFVAAGVCDPYEMYEYVHVSELGNTSGGGMGGMRSLKRMFADRTLDDPEVPSDTLAESFINTMPAWVNMLLLSSSGPIKTPVGACATAAESVDIGVETILSGKARVVVCGGYDDFGEVGSYEFGQMGATQDNAKDRERGRRPDEASRPMTSSRSGFVEAQGSGMQLLMDAALAIEMGVPIYGIVALTNTATDREGRSIPAPGRGILTTARESVKFATITTGGEVKEFRKTSRALDVGWRRTQIERELDIVKQWESEEVARAQDDDDQVSLIRNFASKKRTAVYETWGQGFYRKIGNNVSPLTGALAVWGLTIEDIGVVSCHGTSTLLNDKNESSVIHAQLEHLGRSSGNVVFVVAQKWLTAHPKGAAAAWMCNGALQILNSSIVPGNRNLDNCSEELRKFNFLFYPNRSIQVPVVESVLLKSFGFGQAGAEILLVHPNRLLATLSENVFEAYKAKRAQRERVTFRYMQGVFSGKHPLIRVKTRAPYLPEQQTAVYLNPDARASYDNEVGTWVFRHSSGEELVHGLKKDQLVVAVMAAAEVTSSAMAKSVVSAETRLKVTLQEQAEGLSGSASGGRGGGGIGVDVEPISTFQDLEAKAEFIHRNFTLGEIKHCMEAASPAASFAGRWAAKEAVVKALSNVSVTSRNLWSGASAPLITIEIQLSASGAPIVVLHGHSKGVSRALGVDEVKVSISHAGDVAVAQAVAVVPR